jgi:FkbM family methyltransferase
MTVAKHDNLVIDVGMHDGQDTAFYLAKGFDVVAVEANPDLIEAARARFADSIAAGALRIFGVAIADAAGVQPFAIADDISIWSSLSTEFIERNQTRSGTAYRYVDVPTMTFESILEEVGVPHYLKIDIEGSDMLCVRALRTMQHRPDYVSLESAASSHRAEFSSVFDELAQLWALEYRRFAYVNQRDLPGQRPPAPPAEGRYVAAEFTTNQSGLFGEELPVPWEPIDRALVRAQMIRLQHNTVGYGGRWTDTLPSRVYARMRRRLGRQHSWYDLHAALAG